MYVNECGMLTAIDKTIKFRSLVPMNTKQHDEYYRALDQILRHYNNAGFVITTIHCDGEYCGMMDKVSDNMNVKMNFTNTRIMFLKQNETIVLLKKESALPSIAFPIRQFQES